MFNDSILSILTLLNIFLLAFSTFNLLKRKHIVNLLVCLSIFGLVVLEVGKFGLLFEAKFASNLIGFGLCLVSLFWLVFSVSLLPTKSYSLNRIILSPVLGFVSLVFILIWWIKPFINLEYAGVSVLSKIARYFFILFIMDLSLCLSNLERSLYFLRYRYLRLLLVSAVFLLVPYIFLATYGVLFSQFNLVILKYSSLSVFIGGVIFLFASYKELSTQDLKEDTAINASLALFLIGGYLFFVGAFIKLFQIFGWNLNVLFSFLTSLFIFFVLLLLVFASSFKKRIRNFFLRHFTRQRYDWQKIWEDFTYRISLITDIEKIKSSIKDAVSRIMELAEVEVFVFDKKAPFEERFADWILRYGEAFKPKDVLNNSGNVFPQAYRFFEDNRIEIAAPLYGDKKIIGIISLKTNESNFVDKELLKVLCLQASSVILNCWAYQKLGDAEKKESIYKLSSFVIHDVKNYVNNLSLLVANKDKFHKPEFQEDALFTLENTIEKMKRLMEEFKALRGDLAINKQECNLGGLIEEVIKDLGKDRFRDVNLVVNVNNTIDVFVDAHYIHKVFLNLLVNSLEAMGNRGELSITAQSLNGYAILVIKDNGCGMSKEFMETKLLRPFASTKPKGLGIGLYQCKAIIEAHGGKIDVQSEENKGTIFRVSLPVAKKTVSRIG